MPVRLTMIVAVALGVGFSCEIAAAPALDFETFKSRVEPVFLQKRDGHTRCYVCHAESNNNFRLEKLSPGSSAWTEEQSRKNFEMVSKIVQAVDDPLKSKILIHPLAPESGGDAYHSGGRQFATKNDPLWKTIADWTKGATLPAGKK